jgi:dynein heavy chain
MCDRCFQKEAEDALAEALPALEEARIALEDLDKNDVTEIRYCTVHLYS